MLDELISKSYDNEEDTQALYGYDLDGNRISMDDVADSSKYIDDAVDATKHMLEYLTRDFMTSSHINNQELLRSFQSAVNAATKNGISYGKLINVGGWELKFSIREGDKLPVIIHALYRP